MKRTRSMLIVNVLAVIDAWHKDRLDECASGNDIGGTLNDTMKNLLGRIDWDLVPLEVIKRAVAIILKTAPIGDVRDVSEEADSERDALAYVQVDRLRDAARHAPDLARLN